jgi:hypothetical protein
MMDETMNPSMDPMEEGATEEMPATEGEEVTEEAAPAEMPEEETATEDEAI